MIILLHKDISARAEGTRSPLLKRKYEVTSVYSGKIRTRCLTTTLIVLVEATVVLWLSIPFFQTKNHRTLPFKIWLPFDNISDKIFWIIYVPNSLAIISVSFIAIANDSMVSGFMIAACGQFQLLNCRFRNIPKHVKKAIKDKQSTSKIEDYENKLVVQSICHHKYIFALAESIRKTFSFVILAQFVTSSIVISINVYHLSMIKSINVLFLINLLYLSCMLTEFFVYCWFANELSIASKKFGSSIFEINWTALSIKSNKLLLFVALRSIKPIVISNGHFVVLSLDSFTKILKASYTVFNLLRTS